METKELMTKDLTAVGADLTLERAHALMLGMSARHLPVVDEHNRVIGIVSDRDVLMHAFREGAGFVYAPLVVSDVMTPAPFTAGPSTPVPVVASLMLEHKIDAVPVVSDDELVGLVTSSDLSRPGH